MSTDAVIIEQHASVLTITLNRPEKKNALTRVMYERLVEGLAQASKDNNIRAVILTGAANNFTSGNDIYDFLHAPRNVESSEIVAFLNYLSQFDKPLLAAVDGVAIGVGTTMLLHCDLVCASTEAVFQLPFVNLGLCPEAGSSFLLPYYLSYVKAAELILLGEKFSAQTAHELKLINYITPPGNALKKTLSLATKIVDQPPAAIRLSKQLLKQGTADAVKHTIARESVLFAERLDSPEAAKAFRAFLEKRPANFAPPSNNES